MAARAMDCDADGIPSTNGAERSAIPMKQAASSPSRFQGSSEFAAAGRASNPLMTKKVKNV